MAGKKVSQAQQDAQYRAIFLSPGRSLSLADSKHAAHFEIRKVCTILPLQRIAESTGASQKAASLRRSTRAQIAVYMSPRVKYLLNDIETAHYNLVNHLDVVSI